MEDKKQDIILKVLKQMQENLESLISLVEQGSEITPEEIERLTIEQKDIESEIIGPAEEGGRVVEGVFNGEVMVGSDGKEYTVVEGIINLLQPVA